MLHDPATCNRSHRAGRRLALAAAGVLLAGAASAAGVSYCVSSGGQLQSALSSSSDTGLNNGQDAVIRLVAGTYPIGTATGGGPFSYVNTASTGTLAIEGGYNADCSVRSPDALATIIDGLGVSQVMVLESSQAEIDISGLTIQNGNTSAVGAGLVVNPNPGDVATVRIFDNVIRNNHSSTFVGGLAASTNSGTHIVFVYSNLIVDNSANEGYGGAAIVGNSGSAVLYDDTVSGNTTLGMNAVGGADCSGSGECEVFNSIFWGNSNVGLRLSGDSAFLGYNDIDVRMGTAFISGDLGNLSVLPKFVDSAGGDFHLASGSPLFGTSPDRLGGIDIDGHAYASMGVQDMGVYAQTIYSNGFDPLPQQ